MIRTGPVSSWSSPEALGPIYPFVGWEGAMALACLALWLGWMLWQWRVEQLEYRAQAGRSEGGRAPGSAPEE